MNTRFKKLWHQTKFPMLIGGILAAVSCTPIILITSNSIFMVAFIAGTCITMPFLMPINGHLLRLQGS